MATTAEQFSRISLDKGPDNSYSGDLINTIELALSENINDQELAKFYKDLMVSEANHYTMFLNFARKYGDRKEVDSMWKNLLLYEAKVISKYGKTSHIHG